MAEQFPPVPEASPEDAPKEIAQTPPPEPLGPIREGERLLSIDVLRGVAILGIYFVNMQFFSMPLMRIIFDPSLADAPLEEQSAWFFMKAFCEMKFISLFSMLFGIGLVVQMTRAEARGRSFVPVFLRRLAVLGVIGFLHATLLWYGDILLIYAVLGVPLLFLRKLTARTLIIIALILCCVTSFLGLALNAAQIFNVKMQEQLEETQAAVDAREAAVLDQEDGGQEDGGEEDTGEASTDEAAPEETAPDEQTPEEPLRGLEAMGAAVWDPSSEIWQEAEIAAYSEGPVGDVLAFRLVTYAMAFASTLITWGWRIGAMFLVGAALMKSGFFLPERRAWQRRAFVLGFLIGVPMEVASASITVANGYEITWYHLITLLLHDWGSIALCFGYLGAITLIVGSSIPRIVLAPFANVGRLALSAYLGETVIATGIMYWWGLGWFGTVGHAQQIGLVLVIFVVLMILCTLWLKVFGIGPVEWVWRTLTYFRFQPIRRRD